MAETEVLVVGSGPAGLAAAISAAREGVKTLLVERYGCFGGNITQVGVNSISWYRYEGTTDVEGIGIFPEFLDGYGVLVLPITGRYFQIPYGILVPEQVEYLLIAGRCVSGDKISHAALRSMMCCTVTGQWAGVAAALSLKDRVKVGEVNINSLQDALRKQGVRLD